MNRTSAVHELVMVAKELMADADRPRFDLEVARAIRAIPRLKDDAKADVALVVKALGKSKAVVDFLRARVAEGEKVDEKFASKYFRDEVLDLQANRGVSGYMIWEQPDFLAGIRQMVS